MMRKMGISLLIGAIAVFGILSVSVLAYQEAPELRVLVAAGELPPVDERLPKQPLVLIGVDGLIGEYGGVLHLATDSPGAPGMNVADKLIRSHHGTAASRFFAKIITMESQEDDRVWILHYREGLRWSDGILATVDDTMFYLEDYAANRDINPEGPVVLNGEVGGVPLVYEKVDDYTLRISATEPFDPNNKWRYFVAGALLYPKHYLSQFHPNYVEKEKLDKMVKDAGLGSWVQLFELKCDLYGTKGNLDCPTMFPWMPASSPTAIPVIWKRNPYYYAVDEAGNQLPYIDEIHHVFTGNTDVTTLNILAGNVDFASKINPLSFPLLKKAEDEGKIKVAQWSDGNFNEANLQFNLTHEDPVMREILQNKDFRFAASYALDRQMVSDVFFFGSVQPWQVAPPTSNPYYHEAAATVAIEYDPEKANVLLDGMGLDKRDANGWRLRPDGKTLEITIVASQGRLANADELGAMVTEQLQAVGLKINLRVLDSKVFAGMMWLNGHDCILMHKSWGTTEGGEAWNAHWKMGPSTVWAPLWRKWWKEEDGAETPIPLVIEACELSDKAQSGTLAKKQVHMKRVLDIAAENLWTIGLVESFGLVTIYNPALRNMPTTFKMWLWGDFGSAELWFYEK